MEPHTVLGVSANASTKDINDAFRALAMKWHPDRNPGNVKEATKMMAEINIAKKTMHRRAERAKTKACTEESSSSSAHKNPSSSSECSTSPSHHASNAPDSNMSSREGSERNSRKTPPPMRRQSKDADHRPQSFFSTFLPKPFGRPASSSSSNPPPSPDLNVTNEYDDCFLMGRISKEWVHPLKLSLEDLFHGKRFNVRLERYQLSGTRRPVVFTIDVPPGCEAGTRMVFKKTGHESRDGQRQDIVFVIEEANHKEFTRTGNDLSINVEVPWDDRLTQGKQRMGLEGLGGESLVFTIDHCYNNAMKGTAVIPAAGMPVSSDPSGQRGDLVVHWEISKTGSQWLRKVFRMKG